MNNTQMMAGTRKSRCTHLVFAWGAAARTRMECPSTAPEQQLPQNKLTCRMRTNEGVATYELEMLWGTRRT